MGAARARRHAGDERRLRGRLRSGKWVGRTAAGDERPWRAVGGGEEAADGRNGCGELRGRLRTAWVQGGGWRNGWGEEAAGDERPWLRGRLRTGNGCGEAARNGEDADGVGARDRK